ncbi:unnamed protein product [Clonostachys byssicola]|uniref:Rhodopsin domain-containing protein n=1 Tax=Clonostachys byssicola TaxID=160290 RepID=A0A9N9UUG9_9HYPO|nr:unnamed protein product [Clonostachys byssicola]
MWARDSIQPAMIVFLAVNTLCVGLRVYVRTMLSKSFGYDDYAMVLAHAGFIILCTCTFISVKAGYGDDAPNPDYDVVTAVKFFVISTIEYVILVFVAKVSVALVLYRLASSNNVIRRILEASVGIMAIWTTVTSVMVGLQCRPLSLAWGVGEGTCMSAKTLGNVGYAISSMDIASSFLYAIIPVFLLKGVQLSPKMKASVIFLLGMGVVSSIATVLRLKYLIDVANMKSPTGAEAANAYLVTFVFSITELGLTIFTASLAALRPLLKFIPWGSIGSQGRSYKKSANSRIEMGPNIKLSDIQDTHQNTSEEHIVQKGPKHSVTDVEV